MKRPEQKIRAVTAQVLQVISARTPSLILGNSNILKSLSDMTVQHLQGDHSFVCVHISKTWAQLFKSAKDMSNQAPLRGFFEQIVWYFDGFVLKALKNNRIIIAEEVKSSVF